MSDSIIAAVMRMLTPDTMGKIAAATGLDATAAQKAADASVPAILGGLADLAAKPGGARQLASAVAEQPAGLLSTLTSALTGNGQFQQKGADMLSSLLGGDTLATQISGVSRFAGIGEGPARGLMGLLTPIILGALGSQQRAAGMEASGLARLLTDQKNQFAAAMPAGLSNMLSTGAIKEGVRSAYRPESYVQDASRAAYSQYRAVGTDVQRAVSDTGKASPSWAYWALPLLALAGLFWYLLPGNPAPDQAVKATSMAPASVSMPRPDEKAFYLTKAPADWKSVGTYYKQDIYNRAGEKIGSIKDLLVGPDGKVNAAVISIGRFLGLGEKDIAVPAAALRVEQRDNAPYLTIDVAKDILKAAPAFEAGR